MKFIRLAIIVLARAVLFPFTLLAVGFLFVVCYGTKVVDKYESSGDKL